MATGVIILATAGWRTSLQLQTWQNSYTMWENCLRVSPINPLARRAMAEILSNRGRFDLAIPHYHMALRVEPDNVDTLQSFSVRLATSEGDLRDCTLAIRLARRGCEVTGWKDHDIRRALAIAYVNSATDLERRGEYAAAIAQLREAINAEPRYDIALFNLAALLATSEDLAARRPDEAVALAERGCKLAGQPDASRLRILALAHAAAGNRDTAIATLQKAAALAEAAGDTKAASELRGQIETLRTGVSSP
jgi:tetratricopeptide (TPR) repeat protein